MSATPFDPAIPSLGQALDIEQARRVLARQLGSIDIIAARLVRHKPGRRALIEYDAVLPAGPLTIVGKIRAKGLDTRTHATLLGAREAGLPVPEPLGLVPELQMQLQRKESGVQLTGELAGPRGLDLAQAAAEIAHQLHQAGIPTSRRHTLDDEMRILHDRLPLVGERHPYWADRLARVLDASDRLAATIPEPAGGKVGIHRDYYADQLLVDGDRVVLLDFDLYCAGDPALDIGNFAAHIIEQSLRELGSPVALADRERALVERYLALAGPGHQQAVAGYITLSLVRHIWISTRIPERHHITGQLLDFCEQRLQNVRDRIVA